MVECQMVIVVTVSNDVVTYSNSSSSSSREELHCCFYNCKYVFPASPDCCVDLWSVLLHLTEKYHVCKL